jgi:hypothetical protein
VKIVKKHIEAYSHLVKDFSNPQKTGSGHVEVEISAFPLKAIIPSFSTIPAHLPYI